MQRSLIPSLQPLKTTQHGQLLQHCEPNLKWLLPTHKRASILANVAKRIAENRDDLVRLLNLENGRTFQEIDHWDIDVAIRILQSYAEESKRLYGQCLPLNGVPGHENPLAFTIYEPIGLIVAIVPFNYPVELWAHKVAGALATGNVVITKAPEECHSRSPATLKKPACRGALTKCLRDTGNVVGAQLVRSPDVQMISMTGSTEGR